MQILTPVPDPALASAAALWRAHFGVFGWPRRVRAGHGIVALDAGGDALLGVMGLRDGDGGFAARPCPLPAWLFREAPPTGDLVIDGLAVTVRRQGVGRALMARARLIALRDGRPGLRAEVRASNHGALAFYAALGFLPVGAGRYGPPWWGAVQLLRLPLSAGGPPDPLGTGA